MPQKFNTGEVYIVRFHPSVGSELKRFRPAVIVSEKIHQIDSRFTLIAPLTSNVKQFHESELLLSKKKYLFLEKDSNVLLWYLRTIDVLRLEQKIGQLSSAEVVTMKNKLKELF